MTQINRLYASSGPEVIIETLQITIGSDVHYLCQGYEDTGTPAGRFVFHVMGALAEMERELNIERTRAGLAAARERGRIGGRRKIMTRAIINRAEEMLIAGATRQQVADVIGVGVKTIYKYFPVG